MLVREGDQHRVRRYDKSGNEIAAWDVPTPLTINPASLAVAPDGTTAVLVQRTIQLYDPQGKQIGSWEHPWLVWETQLAFWGDYLIGNIHHRDALAVYSRDGQVVKEFKEFAGGPGKFYAPMAFAIGADGDLFVEQLDGKALRFRLEGPGFNPVFVEEFVTNASTPGSASMARTACWSAARRGLRAFGRGGRRLMATDPKRDLSRGRSATLCTCGAMAINCSCSIPTASRYVVSGMNPPSGSARSSLRSPSSTLVVVAPVYNEVEGIAHFVEAVIAVMERLPYVYTLLLVDDGGTDGTGAEVDALQSQHPDRITVLHLSRNFGHQAALTAGMDYADGDAVICLDADMQHPPELIPELVARWEQGFDIVQATRQYEPTASWFKQLTARGFYALINRLSATRIEPNAADFRLPSRRVIEVFKQDLRERDRFVRGLVRWSASPTARSTSRPAALRRPHALLAAPHGELARTGLISFSKAPLKVAVVLGLGQRAQPALQPVRDSPTCLQCRHPRLGVDGARRDLPRRLPTALPRPHRRVHRHHLRRDQRAPAVHRRRDAPRNPGGPTRAPARGSRPRSAGERAARLCELNRPPRG